MTCKEVEFVRTFEEFVIVKIINYFTSISNIMKTKFESTLFSDNEGWDKGQDEEGWYDRNKYFCLRCLFVNFFYSPKKNLRGLRKSLVSLERKGWSIFFRTSRY